MRTQVRRRVRQQLGALVLGLASGCGPGALLGPRGGPVEAPAPLPPSDPGNYRQFNDQQAAELSKKLAAIQDENKVLVGRLQELQRVLEGKDQALTQARSEIQAVTEEMARTRQDLKRWQQEIATLRDHAHKSDKESQATLQALISLLENMVDQDTVRLPVPPPAPMKQKE